MKKNLFYLICSLLIAITILNNAYAQHATKDFSYASKHFTYASLDSFWAYLFPVIGSDKNEFKSTSLNDVSTKAVKDFKRTFKNVTGEQWYKAADGGEIANFTKNGIQTTAAYNKKGHWQYTVSSYTEEHLPFSVRDLVKKTYYDFSIFRIFEIQKEESTIYLLKIEDKTSWKTIRVCDGDMEVVEDWIKG